jgi:hypothetical protein
MSDAVRALSRLPCVDRTWHSDRVLDQGATQRCVGFAWAAFGISAPVEDPWLNIEGHSIYRTCKVIDGDPAGEQGTTLRSGAKAMKKRGRIASYYRADTVAEAADYVALYGPVVIGTEWLDGMQEPGPMRGIIRPTGKVLGGHACLWYGVEHEWAILRNSWGTSWGVGGDCRISLVDLTWLFVRGGEAVAASELPLLP